jgi:hypothetical protein
VETVRCKLGEVQVRLPMVVAAVVVHYRSKLLISTSVLPCLLTTAVGCRKRIDCSSRLQWNISMLRSYQRRMASYLVSLLLDYETSATIRL